MLKKIVVIDDNPEILEFVKEYLDSEGGFAVLKFEAGLAALHSIKLDKPDLVIVDLGLSDIRGETLCAELRKIYKDLPIIVLTGDKSPESLVNSLNAGADDYITKPFNATELVARINAKLRTNSDNDNRTLSAKDLSLDTESFLVARSGKTIGLTAKEFELLKYLLVNKGRVLTRDKILYAVWGYTSEIDSRVVDVHIGKLRKKLEAENSQPVIESVRGFGYKLLDY